MASFNGSKYIVCQLESILMQINFDDEIIVIDDASTDDTIYKIKNLKDTRVKLFQNTDNVGVIGSFERAIRLAQGELIFLSDQDDEWLPNKVNKILNAFSENHEITLCLTDANIIDGDDDVKENTYFQRRGKFERGVVSNILKNKYLGCAIAFKKSLVVDILPIPHTIPAHDMWIGLINEIYGKTFYIDEPLFHYRRHSENVSSMTHANIITMVRWRIMLVYQLAKRVIVRFFL
jgi:glycosyltransferase involved in cell wall biosynthesis